jgi:hypothetical protein
MILIYKDIVHYLEQRRDLSSCLRLTYSLTYLLTHLLVEKNQCVMYLVDAIDLEGSQPIESPPRYCIGVPFRSFFSFTLQSALITARSVLRVVCISNYTTWCIISSTTSWCNIDTYLSLFKTLLQGSGRHAWVPHTPL